VRTPGGDTAESTAKLARLGHQIGASIVWEILHAAGIDPAPRRYGSTWRQFLTSQAHAIIAVDFFHIDTALGNRLYALVFLEHATRPLHITGVTAHLTQDWTAQQASNLATDLGTWLGSIRSLPRDRDGKYSPCTVPKSAVSRVTWRFSRTPAMS
jgi:putative transposase